MARLANQRHELFCQGLAQGKSATQSYIDAGYSKKGADVSASRLLGNASVMLRVEELRERVEKKNELTLDWLIQQGKEMYQESREAKDRTAAASFYDKLCKIRGAYSPERHEHDVSVSGIDIDFIEPDDED
jgi:phage terminase small subunit